MFFKLRNVGGIRGTRDLFGDYPEFLFEFSETFRGHTGAPFTLSRPANIQSLFP
jgi:hypothetical protein